MPTFTTAEAKAAHEMKLEAARHWFPVVAYSTIATEEPHRYQLQAQSPKGHWSVLLGCDDLDVVLSSAHYHSTERGSIVRIVDMHA